MASGSGKPKTLSDALAGIGAVAGFLWGGAVGDADPGMNFWTGAIIGAIGGGIGGKAVGLALSLAIQIALLLAGLGLIVLRLYLAFGGGA